MRRTHKALELGLATLCVGFVAILGVHAASGDPPEGKGGGGGNGPGGPGTPTDFVWVAWHDPAMDFWGDPGAPEYDPGTGLYYPTAPWIEDMGPDVLCVMDGGIEHATSADYIAHIEQTGQLLFQSFGYDFGDPSIDPCPDCPGCAFVQPTIDPDGLVPTEFPLTRKVALHITVEEDGVYCLALMSGVPEGKKKEQRFAASPKKKVKGFIVNDDGSFRMILREPAAQLLHTSGPDEGEVWGYISLGDVYFEKWPQQP